MPFVLIGAGLILILTAFNGTVGDLGSQLKQDIFTGSNNGPSFIMWFLAIAIVGSIGYIPGAKKPADAFLVLILLGIVLKNGGIFTNLMNAIKQGPTTPANATPLAAVPITGAPSVASTLNSATSLVTAASNLTGGASAGTSSTVASPFAATGAGL